MNSSKKDVYDTIQARQQKLANKIKLNKFKKDLAAGVKLYQKKLEDLASEEIPTPKVRQQIQSDYEYQLTRRQRKLSLAREPSEADMEERYRIRKTYHKVIKDNIPEETSLCFHGVKDITVLEDILSSGRLGYLDDEQSNSLTAPGSVDVTTRGCFSKSLGFMGLEATNLEAFLPAGCFFAIVPKDEQEKQDLIEMPEACIKSVYFKENPDRIFAIVSTTENVGYIKKLLHENNLDSISAYSFDEFAFHIAKDRLMPNTKAEEKTVKTPLNPALIMQKQDLGK